MRIGFGLGLMFRVRTLLIVPTGSYALRDSDGLLLKDKDGKILMTK